MKEKSKRCGEEEGAKAEADEAGDDLATTRFFAKEFLLILGMELLDGKIGLRNDLAIIVNNFDGGAGVRVCWALRCRFL